MPNKYLDSVQLGRLVTKIKDHVSTSISTAISGSITTLIDQKCAQAKLDAHPVGSFYESTDSTSPATLFGGTWQEQIPDGELIGTVAAFSSSSLPTGWLLCDGSAVSRTTYAALFTAIGTTYGSGDGSTTFALPNLTNRFIQGSSTAGTVKAAGLPNITGTFTIRGFGNNSGTNLMERTGAIKGSSTSWTGYSVGTGTAGQPGQATEFDASGSNSIYGNSSTVQPPALTMKYAIYTGVTSNHKWVRQS